jgi:hypothetical protein
MYLYGGILFLTAGQEGHWNIPVFLRDRDTLVFIAEAVVLPHIFVDLPGAGHPFLEGQQVSFAHFDRPPPFRCDDHFPFEEIADLFLIVDSRPHWSRSPIWKPPGGITLLVEGLVGGFIDCKQWIFTRDA